jgi:hypothetical protein
LQPIAEAAERPAIQANPAIYGKMVSAQVPMTQSLVMRHIFVDDKIGF